MTQTCQHASHHGDPTGSGHQDQGREFVILVALSASGATREAAERALHQVLPHVHGAPGEIVDCWWIAEDVRHDGSDNDSAVFVAKGNQDAALALLRAHELTS